MMSDKERIRELEEENYEDFKKRIQKEGIPANWALYIEEAVASLEKKLADAEKCDYPECKEERTNFCTDHSIELNTKPEVEKARLSATQDFEKMIDDLKEVIRENGKIKIGNKDLDWQHAQTTRWVLGMIDQELKQKLAAAEKSDKEVPQRDYQDGRQDSRAAPDDLNPKGEGIRTSETEAGGKKGD